MVNDYERMERADRAKRLLNDDTLLEAFDLLEQRYVQELRDTTLTQESERNQLWHRWQAVLHLKRELEAMVDDGMLVNVKLEKSRKLELRMTRNG